VFRDTLFLYQHMRTETFILARWLNEHHVFLPLLDLGAEPYLNDEIVAKFLAIVHPAPEQTAEVALQRAADNERRQAEALDNERKEVRAQMLRDECKIKVKRGDVDGTVFAPTGALSD
jgi:hypothetical protein